MSILLAAGVALLGSATAVGHSLLSERMFLQPLFADRAAGFFAPRSRRAITRAIFHIPSLTWAVLGIAVLVARMAGGNMLVSLVAATILAASGLANLAALRRPHPGGLMLVAATFLIVICESAWNIDPS